MKRPKVSDTTEQDINALPDGRKFKHKCTKCDSIWPSKRSLSAHCRHCRKRRVPKKIKRKGSVADKIATRHKVELAQSQFDKVKIGNLELENLYAFVYLGTEIAGDGDQEVTVKHRCDISWGRFGEYRQVLTTTKLPIKMRTGLFASLVGSTMTYGAEAWFLTKRIKQQTNGVASKMLSMMTRRSIHQEAKQPTHNVIADILKRRWDYLGHILRMPEERILRKFVLELQPQNAPFTPGSLLDDTCFTNKVDIIDAASNRQQWRKAQVKKQNICW